MTGRRIPDDIRAAIAAAYAAGHTSVEVAKEYGVGSSAVIRIVREYGVKVRPPHVRASDDIAWTGGWYQDGYVMRPRGVRPS